MHARQARRPRRTALAVLGAFGLAVALAPAGLRGPPRLVWNVTASAPEGLYWVDAGRMPGVGEWAAVAPPAHLAAWLATRGYAPRGVLLIKQDAAAPPQLVCRLGDIILVDQVQLASALAIDHAGRPLPAWRGCRRLADDEVFLLNSDTRSLDGRYFGPVARVTVVGRARPIAGARRPDA